MIKKVPSSAVARRVKTQCWIP